MIPLLLGALIATLTLGYLWHRDHTNLQATIDDRADTAAENVVRVAELEGTVAQLEERDDFWQQIYDARGDALLVWRDKAKDTERLLVAERARNEIHEASHCCLPTLDGIATHGVTNPVGEVVDDEPVWVGLVREVADVVPLQGRGRRA